VVGHFERKFQTKTGSPTNAVGVGKVQNNFPALACGIKMSAVYCLVLSQTTRVAETDGRTELRPLIPRGASIAARAVKIWALTLLSFWLIWILAGEQEAER